MADKKYYWLKLKRDFFKRHDIQIIEAMPNGKDYVLFYLKMLAESVDHNGQLRFSEMIPYNEEMLAVITRTNIDIVKAAMKLFNELQMVDVLDDKTIYLNEINSMLGGETYWAEQKRKQRIGQCPTDVQLLSDASPTCPSKRKSKSKSKNSLSEANVIPPTADMVTAYCSSRNNGIDAQEFISFYDSKGWMVGSNKMVNWQGAVRTWEQKRKKDEPEQLKQRKFTTIEKDGQIYSVEVTDAST